MGNLFNNRSRLNEWTNDQSAISINIFVKPYSVKELCNLYEVKAKIFNKWLDPFRNELGDRTGWYFTVNQVELIFSRLGVPYKI